MADEVGTAVRRRAQGRCEECGEGVARLLFHHTSYPEVDTPEVLQLLCGRCHRLIHLQPGAPRRPKGRRSQQRNREPTSMRLSPEAIRLARALAQRLGVSQAATMELALRLLAKREGVE